MIAHIKVASLIALGLALAAGTMPAIAAQQGGDAQIPKPPGNDSDVLTVGRALDRLAKEAEEWGTMHMSAALLVEPSTNFNFNLERGATNYFNEAKSEIQAVTAGSDQRSQAFSGAVQVQNMPGLPNSVTSINSSNLPNSSAIIGQNTNAQAVFSSPGFTAPLGLLPSLNAPNPTLNNLAALNIAAADQTTEAIFRLLGDPEKAAQYAGRKILYGVVTVSISPGYRTRKDYVADLGVLLRFEYVPARPEIIRRWVQGTNLTDEVRAAILVSYKLHTNADLMSRITWLGERSPFDQLNHASAGLNELKTKLDGTNAVLKALDAKAPRRKDQDKYDAFSASAGDLTAQYKKAKKNYQKVLAGLGSGLPDWSRAIPDDLIDTTNQPLAMAVSPLADRNVTDEASSQRNQAAFALSLSGLLQQAGLQAQAAAVEQYARRIERDSHTRTALPVITTYGDGGLFGWQVGPRFRAMDDPAVRKSGVPANVLDRQTFPALIIVGFNQDDLSPRLTVTSDNHVRVLEPYLAFRTVPRWVRLKDCWWGRLWQKRYSESDILRLSAGLVRTRELLKNLAQSTFDRTADLAKYRLRALSFDFFGNDTGQNFDVQQVTPLPEPPSAPVITAVLPDEIRLQPDDQGNPRPANLTFAIVGNNLKSAASITNAIGPVTDIKFSQSTNNNVLLFSATVTTNEPIVFALSARLTNNVGVVTTNVVFANKTVRVAFHNDANAPAAIVKTVQTPISPTSGVAEFTVRIATNAPPKALEAALSIMLNEINRAKPQDHSNVSVQVQAEQRK